MGSLVILYKSLSSVQFSPRLAALEAFFNFLLRVSYFVLHNGGHDRAKDEKTRAEPDHLRNRPDPDLIFFVQGQFEAAPFSLIATIRKVAFLLVLGKSRAKR